MRLNINNVQYWLLCTVLSEKRHTF